MNCTVKQYYHHLARHSGGPRVSTAAVEAGAEAAEAYRRRTCGTAASTATVRVVRHREVVVDIATALALHAQRPAGTGRLTLRKQVAA